MRNLFLKKEFLLMVRIIAIMAIILLSIGEYRNIIFYPIINENGNVVFSELRIFLENSLSIVLFFFLILNPQKLELIALGSFMYAINCTVFNTNIIMGFMMYVLGNAVLYVRGYYLKKTKPKIVFSIIFYMFIFYVSEILLNRTKENFKYIRTTENTSSKLKTYQSYPNLKLLSPQKVY